LGLGGEREKEREEEEHVRETSLESQKRGGAGVQGGSCAHERRGFAVTERGY